MSGSRDRNVSKSGIKYLVVRLEQLQVTVGDKADNE